jgi:hypothetical protein
MFQGRLLIVIAIFASSPVAGCLASNAESDEPQAPEALGEDPGEGDVEAQKCCVRPKPKPEPKPRPFRAPPVPPPERRPRRDRS